MEISIGMVVAAVTFALGALFFGGKKSSSIKEIFKTEKEKTDAVRELRATQIRLRLLKAKRAKEKREKEAREAMASDPISDDPVADLRDRLDKSDYLGGV